MNTTSTPTDSAASASEQFPHRPRAAVKVGLVGGGLGTYWPQFPPLRPQLEESLQYVTARLQSMGADVVEAGFISDARDAARSGDALKAENPDIIVIFLGTYLTSSMILPIAQRADAPILVIDLQPSEKMDHAIFDTGQWLAYCGQCSVPEIGNLFRRAGIRFHSVTGYLKQESAWTRIERWINAARIRSVLRHGRLGALGHVYPGMLDVSTDYTLLATQLGIHVEVLEFDDLRERVNEVSDSDLAERVRLARSMFDIDESVREADLNWAAKESVGLDQLVEDFDLDALAYYHRGLAGEIHERLGAGMILGASLLTGSGIPTAGEFELRNAIAMLICDQLGAGGSFTEIQAINFDDGVVEMGHDGPAHLGISSRKPILRGLGVYHGKRGYGVSVEFDVRHGPVTLVGLGQDADGTLRLVTAEGEVSGGPLLQIGNTTSRVNFHCDPGEWVDAWSASGVDHHWSLAVGHISDEVHAVAQVMGMPFAKVSV